MMNQTLQTLAERAGSIKFGGKNCFFGDEDITKFAELIINECTQAMQDMHMWQSVNNQNYPNAWHDAVDQCIEHVLEQFKND